MNIFIFNIYIFLAQFPALFKLGSSNFGMQIFLLPLLFFNKKLIKVSTYIYLILLLSFIWGLINYQANFDIFELLLRLAAVQIALGGLIYPLEIFNKFKIKKDFFLFYTKKFLYLNLPTITFLYLEVIYKFTKNTFLYNFLFKIKEILVRGRDDHTIGTISGFFPEHGLFVPYLFLLSGLSCIYLFYKKNKKTDPAQIIAISWISMLLFHQSGLYIFSILMILITVILFLIIKLIQKKKIIKNLLTKIIPFSLLLSLTGFYWFMNTQEFLYKRFSTLFSFYNQYGLSIDKSIYFKSLPFMVLSKIDFKEFFLGSGISQYTRLVISKIDKLPTNMTSDIYFLENLNRFPLNSLFTCQFLEYGLFFSTLIIVVLIKFQLIKPIRIGILYANIFKNKSILILSTLLFLGSFLSGFGAVPLTYPHTFLSIPMIILISESK